MRVDRAFHRLFRERGGGIVYDNTHGVETEADLTVTANEAFQLYDKAEASHTKRPPPASF